jgi:hypothetical protein
VNCRTFIERAKGAGRGGLTLGIGNLFVVPHDKKLPVYWPGIEAVCSCSHGAF